MCFQLIPIPVGRPKGPVTGGSPANIGDGRRLGDAFPDGRLCCDGCQGVFKLLEDGPVEPRTRSDGAADGGSASPSHLSVNDCGATFGPPEGNTGPASPAIAILGDGTNGPAEGNPVVPRPGELDWGPKEFPGIGIDMLWFIGDRPGNDCICAAGVRPEPPNGGG